VRKGRARRQLGKEADAGGDGGRKRKRGEGTIGYRRYLGLAR
jgi:hypothetical protein